MWDHLWGSPVVLGPMPGRRSLPGWLPNVLTASRFAWAGLGYGAALAGNRGLVTGLVAVAVATDLVDGPLARRLGTADGFGDQLDTVADAVFYGSLLAWVYILDPGIPLFTSLRPWVLGFAGLVVATLLLGRLRRGTVAFHTPFTRASATVGVGATVWTINWGYEAWVIQALAAVLAVDLAHRLALLAGWIPAPEGPRTERGR